MLMDRSPIVEDDAAGKEAGPPAVLSQDYHLMHMAAKSPQKAASIENSLE